jgi:ABC-type dipeptide/oligopeptide/nickel transport system ATPase component
MAQARPRRSTSSSASRDLTRERPASGGIDCTRDPRAAHHLIGVVPDESNLYPELTGFENLCFCGALFGMVKRARRRRARALLDRFDLASAADRLFAGYSRGTKRKLTIAAGIIHEPQILFLDEPTTGLDVLSARQLPALLRPVAYVLPLTYGAEELRGAVHGAQSLPLPLDYAVLAAFCVGLFVACLWSIKRQWIL